MDVNQIMDVGAGKVVSLDYELIVEGDLIDSTRNLPPLEYLHGHGNIIAGLERGLTGMQVGESRDVLVPAIEAYGLFDPNAFVELDRAQFPSHYPLEIGSPLHLRDETGRVLRATICSIEEQTVRADLNHPLAGKDLAFQVKVVGIRDATPDELASGRVGGGGCSGCSSGGGCDSGSCDSSSSSCCS